MNIDIKQYILNDIGDTSWHGESLLDNLSLINLEKLNGYLYEIENLRDELLIFLEEHKDYRKGNASAEMLHNKAERIIENHTENKELKDRINMLENMLCSINRKDTTELPTEIRKKSDVDVIKQLQQENWQLKKYKNAWNELKNDNAELIEYNNRAIKDCKIYKNRKMYLLEQKYELGGE